MLGTIMKMNKNTAEYTWATVVGHDFLIHWPIFCPRPPNWALDFLSNTRGTDVVF